MASTVTCFGEILLRLSGPGCELLLQSPTLNIFIGGAEANVAVSLAHFGHKTSVVTSLPENPMARAAVGELRRHGVDTKGIRFHAEGRLGLYFLETGAGHRPSNVIYDRADSTFALTPPTFHDSPHALSGADWLHVSGITPAVGPRAADAALQAVKRASEHDISVSFDCNYRAKLWERWRGDAPRVLQDLASHADLMFGEERDLALILGLDLSNVPPRDRFVAAGEAAFKAFPRLRRLATTVRIQHNVDHHELAARMLTRDRLYETRFYTLGKIVDRIGSGDAYAAGVLHGICTGMDDQTTIEFGLGAAVLKHSIPGDFNIVGVSDVQSLLTDGGFAVRR
jgi:2-dehydro-3-deoxygluconokinase